MMDRCGIIKQLHNCIHSSPSKLLGIFFPSLFVDGFAERFNKLRLEVLNGKGPRDFIYILNVDGRLAIRRCKIILTKQGLMVINNSTEYLDLKKREQI